MMPPNEQLANWSEQCELPNFYWQTVAGLAKLLDAHDPAEGRAW